MHLWIQCMLIRVSRVQRSFDSFPGLFAVFHALLRLLAPRHPPHALSSLAALFLSSSPALRKPSSVSEGKRLPSSYKRPTIAHRGSVTILFCSSKARTDNTETALSDDCSTDIAVSCNSYPTPNCQRSIRTSPSTSQLG